MTQSPTKTDFCVIFDFDGVLFDSSAQHKLGWETLAAETERILPDDHFERSFGMRNEQVIPNLLGWTQDDAEIATLADRKEEIFRDIIGKDGIKPLPGVIPFLELLRASNVPTVIGTSTPKVNLDCIFGHSDVRHYFDAFVTSEDVRCGKPDPEVFLKSAERLGYEPSRCIVFEDAHVGIEAGLAAGMKVIAVATTNAAEELTRAHRVVHRLDELDISDLRGLIKQT